MSAHPFQYAVMRVVPRVERGEFINAGIVLYCRARSFLDARVALDETRLLALARRYWRVVGPSAIPAWLPS